MKTRIKSKGEFIDKIEMASQIQNEILDGTASELDITKYNVLMSEIKEYKPVFLKSRPKK